MDDAFLEDLGSTNGTMVNGKTVKKHFLQDNDVVELGKYKLKYVVEKKAQPKALLPRRPRRISRRRWCCGPAQ
jgi:pSer/pThr/pTyr-binding forkhead associated (FHA) protein